MPKKTFTAEQIVAKLRQIEVLVSQGKTVPVACKEGGITDQAGCRWNRPSGCRTCKRKTRSCGGRLPISR